MKRYSYIIIITIVLTIFLSGCFDNDNNTNINQETEQNIDEQILQEQQKLQNLEQINENEIDELINTIIP